eukprot:7676995-Alexandrium_andersonii.AAC.1
MCAPPSVGRRAARLARQSGCSLGATRKGRWARSRAWSLRSGAKDSPVAWETSLPGTSAQSMRVRPLACGAETSC